MYLLPVHKTRQGREDRQRRRFTRYGLDKGVYASPIGTPFEMRSLPYGTSETQRFMFEVIQPYPMEKSFIAPAFSQPGLGIQYRMPIPINYLEQLGYIKIFR